MTIHPKKPNRYIPSVQRGRLWILDLQTGAIRKPIADGDRAARLECQALNRTSR